MAKKTRNSDRRQISIVPSPSEGQKDFGELCAGLPEDVVSVVLRHVVPRTARLVNKRTRDQVDLSRKSLCAYGLGRNGRPAAVAARFPNLEDLTLQISCDDLLGAYDITAPWNWAIPWEEYAARIHEGLTAWAEAVGSLRRLRHLHLDIGFPLQVVSREQEIRLLRTFVPRDREGFVTFGSWAQIRKNPGVYKIPVAAFHSVLDHHPEWPGNLRPSTYLAMTGGDHIVQPLLAGRELLSVLEHSTA